MKSLVLVKYVPDANSVFRINAEGTWVDTSSLSYAVNDYDRYALEELLALKDAGKVEEVVALTVGPKEASSALRTCLATGADRAIHVSDDALSGCDPLSLARVIHAAMIPLRLAYRGVLMPVCTVTTAGNVRSTI